MALRGLALAFLLVLAPLLLVWGQKDAGPKNQEGAKEAETCQRPSWDRRLQLAPDQENYKKNEEVRLSCPEGFQPSFTEIKCSGKVQPISYENPVYSDLWLGRDITGGWIRIHSSVQCIDVLQVVPGTLEVSSTSIKLNWTCRLPDACQQVRARCRLEEHSSLPCEAKEVKGEETLHGQEGTFTCPPLQPFTVYSVTISLLPSTILFTRLLRTKETVPDKPEKLWLDPSTGSLRWKALPSCKGEIIGYQLNITARRAHDGSFLEFSQVLVNQSATQYTPPHQTPGSKYTVTVQGLTAAGAGAASRLEFRTYVSVNAKVGAIAGAWSRLWHPFLTVLVAGQPLGLWPGSVVMVVVVALVVVPLSAGILWFLLSRKRKALPRKAEEDHYTELQPYENLDNYCVIKGTFLAEEDAGKGGQAGEMLPQPLPALESSGDSQSSEGKKMGRMSKTRC
ncbi:PREDICTED: uncharacterized protein LOC104833281 [Haliaeetus leucocephalus]|uniref:uncharacterized protein LOC104833281 n=1 Tax=Haliaeetus leucocephalus TaxID=52644 RepID=UPI00053CDA48|nr:PREDICTED: uncharacterized protein LOC104833281 [Haliaeetus leucocephalus]